MNRPSSTPSRNRLRSLFPAVVLIAAVFILVGAAQLPRPHISSVQDWTHHHLIYSQPSTWVSAWKAQQDPRYWQQKIRRGEMNQPREAFGAREQSPLANHSIPANPSTPAKSPSPAAKTASTTIAPAPTGPATPSASTAPPHRAGTPTCAKSQWTATGAHRSASTAQPASPSTEQRGSPSIPQNSALTSPPRPTAPTTSSSSPTNLTGASARPGQHRRL